MLFYLPDFENPVLPETEARHALQVLRMKKGDSLRVTNGKGLKADAQILSDKPAACLLQLSEIGQLKRFQSGEIYLAVAPTKNADRMEWLIEKGTELGCAGFHFFKSKRTERNHLNLERLEKIALSAMKQSGQNFLPEIHWHKSLEELPLHHFDRIITADLSAAENKLKEIPYKKMLLLIGPEGDFTTVELEWLSGKSTESVRFLPQVLRTETAAMYALTLGLVSGRG